MLFILYPWTLWGLAGASKTFLAMVPSTIAQPCVRFSDRNFRFLVEKFPPKSGFWISDLELKFWALFKGK